MASPRVYTESELARASNRSDQYVRRARTRGLIAPIGETGSGMLIYAESAINAVNGIASPVLTMHREIRAMAKKYKHVFAAADEKARAAWNLSPEVLAELQEASRRMRERAARTLVDFKAETLAAAIPPRSLPKPQPGKSPTPQ